MKNIHILPTAKPSRLILRKDNKFILRTPITQWHGKNQNIYITSDEEIKEGDYFYQDFDSIIHKCYKLTDNYVIADKPSDYPKRICKKIILTTDQELIKDGIQDIDDEFLEWFVKNPSCEFVEVINEIKVNKSFRSESWDYEYKIIIPKKEPKPFKNMQQLTEVDWEKFKKNPFPSKKEKPKQETLEEAKAQEWIDFAKTNKNVDMYSFVIGYDKGFKWQQEQDKNKFSKEDLKLAYNASQEGWIGFDFWFEQFKKK
jgi:hypothetical protein